MVSILKDIPIDGVKIVPCRVCFNITDEDPCRICADCFVTGRTFSPAGC